MRTPLLVVSLLVLTGCSGGGARSQAQNAPAAPPPPVFAIDYVASPQAHFDAVAEHNRALEAAAKEPSKAPATGFPAPAPAAGFPAPSAPR
jgi:hypothetical protein